jgi:zinc transport system permease protein
MVFVTVAVSQAAGLGVALAFFVGIQLGVEVPPMVGAVAMSLVATALFALSPARLRLSRESVLGLVYVGAWGLAVLVGDRIAQESHDIAAILFGTAVLVRPVDFCLVVAALAVVTVVQLGGYRGFVFVAFDPESARVQGLPVRVLDVLHWGLVALAVSVATRALGVLPVFAFAVLPAMGALATTDHLRLALVIAATVGAAAGGLGYVFAFFFEFPVGASQAVTALLLLVPCLAWARLWRRR